MFRSLGRGAAGAAAAWCPLCRLSGPNKRPCLSWASKTEARSPPADRPSLETGTRRAGALTPSTLWLAGASGPETRPRGSRAWAWLRDSLGRRGLGKPLAPFCPGKLGWKEPCPCSGPQCLPESRSCPEGLHTPDSQRGPSGGRRGAGSRACSPAWPWRCALGGPWSALCPHLWRVRVRLGGRQLLPGEKRVPRGAAGAQRADKGGN